MASIPRVFRCAPRRGRGSASRPRGKRPFACIPCAALVLLAMPTGTPSQSVAGEGRPFVLGDRTVYCARLGEGTPTIVLEMAFGDRYENWGGLLDSLAAMSSLFAYDRAGYGPSDPGPPPRSAEAEVTDLHDLLRIAGIGPPYLLVGHSLGGMNALVFAHRYPEETAGLVLLEPPPLDWIRGGRFSNLRAMADERTAEFERAAVRLRTEAAEAADADTAAAVSARRAAVFYETLASEHRTLFGESAQRLAEVTTLRDLPVAVIGSEVPNPLFGDSAAAFQRFWNEDGRRLAALSSRGRFILAEGATHHLYGVAPALVLDAVRTILGEARRREAD